VRDDPGHLWEYVQLDDATHNHDESRERMSKVQRELDRLRDRTNAYYEGFEDGKREGKREVLEKLVESNVVEATVHALDGRRNQRTYLYLQKSDIMSLQLEAARNELGWEEIGGKREAKKRQKRTNTGRTRRSQ
jgi:hypothetical protein